MRWFKWLKWFSVSVAIAAGVAGGAGSAAAATSPQAPPAPTKNLHPAKIEVPPAKPAALSRQAARPTYETNPLGVVSATLRSLQPGRIHPDTKKPRQPAV